MTFIIGIDFDNTIAIYDDVIHRVALEQGLIPSSLVKNKKSVRDYIRTLENGEILWQKVQSQVYGARMQEASLSGGFMPFMERCKENRIKPFIVSHKTQYAPFDGTKTDLRAAAMKWMEGRGLFESTPAVFTERDVYFEDTRAGKLRRIEYLMCRFFVDDLEETFLEPAFPIAVGKILYASPQQAAPRPDVKVTSDWGGILDHILSARC